MNAYGSLTEIKSSSVLDFTATTDDTRLRRVLEAVSRAIDDWCQRHFYVLEQTKKFDGNGKLRLYLPDLISIDTSGLKTDDDKDRTFETTWPTTDYLLGPSNADPTGLTNPQSQPFRFVDVDVDAGNEDIWTKGRETVQVAGQWGWWEHLATPATSKVDNGAGYDATAVTIVVDDGTEFEEAETIKIGSEQLYVTAISTNNLTVVRGVNGTTAAAISDDAVITIYRYPDPIREVTIMEASKLWKRKDAAFASVIGFPETGQQEILRGFDSMSKMLLSPYKDMTVVAGLGV